MAAIDNGPARSLPARGHGGRRPRSRVGVGRIPRPPLGDLPEAARRRLPLRALRGGPAKMVRRQHRHRLPHRRGLAGGLRHERRPSLRVARCRRAVGASSKGASARQLHSPRLTLRRAGVAGGPGRRGGQLEPVPATYHRAPRGRMEPSQGRFESARRLVVPVTTTPARPARHASPAQTQTTAARLRRCASAPRPSPRSVFIVVGRTITRVAPASMKPPDQIAVGRLSVHRDGDRRRIAPGVLGQPVERRAGSRASSSGVMRFGSQPSPQPPPAASTVLASPPRITGGCGFCAGFGIGLHGGKS